MSNEAIQEIEQNIKDAKKVVEQGNALERLLTNRDFKKVVQEGYFEQEAIRLVHLKADPNFQTPERQANVILQMDGIGAFRSYLDLVFQKRARALSSIAESEQLVEELLNEDAEESTND